MSKELKVTEEINEEISEELEGTDTETEEPESDLETEDAEESEAEQEEQEEQEQEGEQTAEEMVEEARKIALSNGVELTEDQVIKLLEDYENDKQWKQANAEKGRKLNEEAARLKKYAELQERIERDERFKQYIEGYKFQTEEFEELADTYGEEAAKRIMIAESKAVAIEREARIKEFQNMYMQQEKELIEKGIPQEMIELAFKTAEEFNPVYVQTKQRPITLQEALKIASTGEEWESILNQIKTNAKKEVIKKVKKKGGTRALTNTAPSGKTKKSNMRGAAEKTSVFKMDFWNSDMFAGVPD